MPREPLRIVALIPALNEEEALPLTLRGLPAGLPVIVCDNGSTDRTAAVARELGARVVSAPERGYGSALLAGIAALKDDPPDALVIVDADGAADPADLDALLAPLRAGTADLVLGERLSRGARDGLTPPQRWGNALATRLIRLRTGVAYRDLGPFRALSWAALTRLGMEDRTWGWNVEMQMKAAKLGLRVVEVPVANRARHAGTSKISGSVRGVARAGARIVWACWRYG